MSLTEDSNIFYSKHTAELAWDTRQRIYQDNIVWNTVLPSDFQENSKVAQMKGLEY